EVKMITGLSFQISMAQADFLVAHIDTVRPVSADSREASTRHSLIARELIRYTEGEHITSRPSGTMLTQKGRAAVCHILAHYVEQLVRAEALTDEIIEQAKQPVPETKIRISERLEKLYANRDYRTVR